MTALGVIGFGSAGRRHAELLADRGRSVVVSDPQHSAREDAAARGYEILAEAELLDLCDAVVIASPNHLHADHLVAAVDAGCDVLVEKPIAVVPTPEVEAAIGRARDRGLVVGVGYNLRFVPAIEACRVHVREARLGRVLRATADFGYDLRRWRPGRDWRTVYSALPEQGGGILLDAIHEFDYLYWLFGDIREVACLGGARSSLGLHVEDVAGVLLDFESGVIGCVMLDYASGVYRRGFEVVGEEATLSWRWPSPTMQLDRADASVAIPVDGVESMYERLIDDFLDAVAERRPPRAPAEEGLAVLRVVDAARRAVGVVPQ